MINTCLVQKSILCYFLSIYFCPKKSTLKIHQYMSWLSWLEFIKVFFDFLSMSIKKILFNSII